MEETDVAHLAGVFDAVGTITVHISKNSRYTIGYQYQAVVRMVRPKDDSDPLMGKVMAYCEENGVQYSISEKTQTNHETSKSHELFIKNPESIRRFLEPMMPYFVTQYDRAGIMLAEIIPRIEDGKHQTKEGFYELMRFADALRSPDRKGPEPKYTQEYFEDEFSIGE